MKTLPANIKIIEVKEPTGQYRSPFLHVDTTQNVSEKMLREAVELTTLLQSNGE